MMSTDGVLIADMQIKAAPTVKSDCGLLETGSMMPDVKLRQYIS